MTYIATTPILEVSFTYLLETTPRLISLVGSIESLLGFSQISFLNSSISLLSLIHVEDDDLAQDLFRHPEGMTDGYCNLRIRQQNGKIRCCKVLYNKESTSQDKTKLTLTLQDAKSLPRTLNDTTLTANFNSMMENTTDFIYFKDRNHVFTGASQALASIIDPSCHWTQLIGKTDYDVFSEAFADNYYRLEKHVFRCLTSAQEIQSYQTNNAHLGWVDNHKYPIFNDNKEVIGLFGIARDITKQQQMQLSLLKIADFVAQHHGSQALEQMVHFAAELFNVNYVHIAMLEADHNSARVIAAHLDGKALEAGYVYNLNATPCANVIGENKHCCYSKHVQQLFPSDQDLVNLQAEAYIGEPILDRSGKLIGLIVLVSRLPMVHSEVIVSGLRILAAKIATDRTTYQNERALVASEHLLRTVIDEMPDILVVKDEQGRCLLSNAPLARLYNTTPQAMVGKDDSHFGVSEEMATFFRENIKVIINRGQTQIVYEDSRDANTGEIRHFKSIKKPFKDINGKDNVLIIAHDITDILQAQDKVAASEKLHKDILSIAQEGIWDWNIITGTVSHNSRWYQALGYFEEDVGNDVDGFAQLIHPDDKARVLKTLNRLICNEIDVYESTHRLLAHNGQYRWVRDRGAVVERSADGSPTRIVGSFIDDTQQYEAEQALRKERENLRLIIDHAPIGIWLQDGKGKLSVVNKTFCEAMGISEDRFLSASHYAELIPHPFNSACLTSDENALMSSGLYDAHERLPFADGKIHDLRVFKVVKHDKEGYPEKLLGISVDITDRLQKEKLLETSEQRFRMLFKSSRDAIITLEQPDWIFTSANPAAIAMFGADSEETFIAKTPWHYSPEKQPDGILSSHKAKLMIEQALAQGSHLFEWTHKRISGESFFATVLLSCFELNGQRLLQATVRDITEYKKAENALRLSANVFTHAREGIIITDQHANIIDVNETFSQITGYDREDVLGKNPLVFHADLHDKAFYQAMWRNLIEQGYWSGEIWNKRKDGTIFPELATISAVYNDDGSVQNYIALYSDISALKEQQTQLEHIAHYDPLTGQPNRFLLAKRLRESMHNAELHNHHIAVAYLDLDGFKAINDSYGHEVGDELLIELANRMRSTLSEHDTLARIGGDEFVLVLAKVPSLNECHSLFSKLLNAASHPIAVCELLLHVTASLGVTFYPQKDGVDADQLLRQADQAMYQAKQTGKNRFYFFDTEHDRNQRGQHESLEQIRQALTHNEFLLYYQPKVNMRDGAIVGVEALIRWQHPTQGLLSPASFLPIIENNPLSIDLGEWVIRTAINQMEQWKLLGLSIPISVNVNALQLQHPDFSARLQTLINDGAHITSGDLELEVLETSALEDFESISKVMHTCQLMGINFAVDDFGTGYSSLTYLKQLPAEVLKIDQSFVRDMLDDPDDLAILKAILGLATTFNRKAIAEGVETIEHGERLLEIGCVLGQGYAIARPMPHDELIRWVNEWKQPESWRRFNQ